MIDEKNPSSSNSFLLVEEQQTKNEILVNVDRHMNSAIQSQFVNHSHQHVLLNPNSHIHNMMNHQLPASIPNRQAIQDLMIASLVNSQSVKNQTPMFNSSSFNSFLKHLSEISSQSNNKQMERMQTNEQMRTLNSRFYTDDEKMFINVSDSDKNELELNEEQEEIEVDEVQVDIEDGDDDEEEEDEEEFSVCNETMSDEMNNQNYESEEWSMTQTKRRTRKLMANSNNDSSSNSTTTTTMTTATITTAASTLAAISPPFFPSSLISNCSKSSTPTSSISSVSTSSLSNTHHKSTSSELKLEELAQKRTSQKPLKHSIEAILGFSQSISHVRDSETNAHSPRRAKKLKMFIEKHSECSNQSHFDDQ